MVRIKITDIGEMVPAFEEEKLLILFGQQVTAELLPICVVHEPVEIEKSPLKANGKIKINQQEYHIQSIGDAANQNFDELGHISIYFRNEETEVLPGAIVASPEVFPSFAIGDFIDIY
ncbi:PTS glucitol/sorbitol transporter subunit IIA [Enterococcus sp. AZ103]|uniref:PTS glucitol/sorbitol transporter subunit IIA n=1 Tax=Enterococcus sp. AZ103 TaxID=2774628 RepID=UPI003F23EBEC